MLVTVAVCTALVNIVWFATLANWPTEIPLEYTISVTILLSALAAVLSAWSVLS